MEASLIPLVVVLAWLLGTGLVSLVLFAHDKRKAQSNDWRTPEKTLLLSMILGGWMGGGMGIFWIRHKSQHASFQICFGVSALLWTAILVGAVLYAAKK